MSHGQKGFAMPKQCFSPNENVLEAARRRIGFVLDHYERVICSISGGKDSTVLAHLSLVEARKRNRKIGLFLLDEEAMYQSSVDQAEYLMELYPENTIPLWTQIPFSLTNATSVAQGQLQCWEPGESHLWMRKKKSGSIKHPTWDRETETIRNKNVGLGFYDVIDNFERTYTDTAFLVGLRASGEHLNRWRAVTKNPVSIGGKSIYWATRRGKNETLYPIYDWGFHDVWRYISDQSLKYSKIYDLQWRKGYTLNEMRVSSLIHEKAFKSICDLPEFEPKTYEKLLRRIKGIALAQETGKNAKLFKCRKLPKNHKTWASYRDFLIATHSDSERVHIFVTRFKRHLENEYVARQQCRQLILNDYENNLPVDNQEDPREVLVAKHLAYYEEVL